LCWQRKPGFCPYHTRRKASCHRTLAGYWHQRLGIYGDEEGTGPDNITTAVTATFREDSVFAKQYWAWQMKRKRQRIWRTTTWSILMSEIGGGPFLWE
jgi:hypothetical protein